MELSFRKGDIITVFGEMDEGKAFPHPQVNINTTVYILLDGFFIGELSGNRGLVPSNFLQPTSGLPNSVPSARQPLEMPDTISAARDRPKGVMFSEAPEPKRSVTGQAPSVFRQISQNSAGKTPSIGSFGVGAVGGAASKTGKSASPSQLATNKQLTKKTSDLNAKTSTQNAVRKQSQSAKKAVEPGRVRPALPHNQLLVNLLTFRENRGVDGSGRSSQTHALSSTICCTCNSLGILLIELAIPVIKIMLFELIPIWLLIS